MLIPVLFDYGAPIGFRIILAHPERLHALIIQNGNPYKAGLGPNGQASRDFGRNPRRKATKQRHLAGTSHPEACEPESWTEEFAHLWRPGQREIQADLLYEYRANVAAYPTWQAWLRQHQPPTLVVWGANDPSFIGLGVTAYRADLPNAETHLLDAGHFALEEKNDEIARRSSTSWPATPAKGSAVEGVPASSRLSCPALSRDAIVPWTSDKSPFRGRLRGRAFRSVRSSKPH